MVLVASIIAWTSPASAQTTQLCTDCSLGLQLPVIASITLATQDRARLVGALARVVEGRSEAAAIDYV